MLKGRLYIDGIDAFTAFGALVVDDGWGDLIAFPSLKTPPSNDWHEQGSIEVDLSAPRLDKRNLQLPLAFVGEDAKRKALLALLSDGCAHTFDFRTIGRTYRLRLTDAAAVNVRNGLATMTLKLTDDKPLQGYVYALPKSNEPTNTAYTLDARPLSAYGLHILEGTHDELLTPAALKTNLEQTNTSIAGVIYDNAPAAHKSRDVKLYCFMRATTLAELWRNYDALLHDLAQPYERTLYVQPLAAHYYGYYKSCTVQEFYTTPQLWLKFTLTLTLTR